MLTYQERIESCHHSWFLVWLNTKFDFFFWGGFFYFLFFCAVGQFNSVYYVVHNLSSFRFRGLLAHVFPINKIIVCYRTFYNKVLPGKWKNDNVAADVLIQNNKTVDIGSMLYISWAFFTFIKYCYNFVYWVYLKMIPW